MPSPRDVFGPHRFSDSDREQVSAEERLLRAIFEQHDPRCVSLTDSEFNDHCDCRTLAMIDQAQEARDE